MDSRCRSATRPHCRCDGSILNLVFGTKKMASLQVFILTYRDGLRHADAAASLGLHYSHGPLSTPSCPPFGRHTGSPRPALTRPKYQKSLLFVLSS